VAASLRIGCVKYLNARPLIHGWPGGVVFEDPTALCLKLARGELDVALASSFEFLRNPIYRIVDGISISSAGPVYSVIVARARESLEFDEIELDPASQTSVAMLQYLIANGGRKFSPVEIAADKLAPLPANRARLLIGDQAIRFRQRFGNTYSYWDLGKEWHDVLGLPFVYALWLVRPELAKPREVADQLRELRDENLTKLSELIALEKDFDPQFCARYYRENIDFAFGENEKAGLRTFAKLCGIHGLLPKRTIEFNVI
jgi:predicted solute-binding protein